jgi:hypothetical protein
MFVFDILKLLVGAPTGTPLAIRLLYSYPIFAIQHCIITKAGKAHH